MGREFMQTFRERWAKIEQESPTIPQAIHEKSHAQLLRFLSEENNRLGQPKPPKLPESISATDPTALSSQSHSARLLLVRGLPGSGKTTIAKAIPGFVHLEADHYFEKDGQFTFEREKLGDAHAWCLQQAKKELDAGHSVVVSNTFTRNVEMQPYFQLGYPTMVVEATGRWRSTHDVPNDRMELMRQKWEKLAIEIPS